MKITCHALSEFAPKIVPAEHSRAWMEGYVPSRHPYRCLPLAIANSYGWELLCPVPLEIEWNGGNAVYDLNVRAVKPLPGNRPVEDLCRSLFAHGIVTFAVDYIFRTEEGWDLLATGPFNAPKDNISALTGIIETNWLPFPFTMNWKMLRPGTVRFEEGEPFCRILPVKKDALTECELEIVEVSENKELEEQFISFRNSRNAFVENIRLRDAESLKQGWQRHYFLGQLIDGTSIPNHVNRLRLRAPIDLRPQRENAEAASEEPIHEQATSQYALEPANEPTGLNEEGRQCLSADGLLCRTYGIRMIDSGNEAAEIGLLLVENVLSPDQCAFLCETFGSLQHLLNNDARLDPFWRNRFIYFEQIDTVAPEAGSHLIQSLAITLERLREFYRLSSPIYPDLLQITRWPAELFMPAHVDNATSDGSYCPTHYRRYSCVIYLNDDYEGGEVFFTAQKALVRPKRGMLLACQSGFKHEKAFLKVTSGTQLTMTSFATFDPRAGHFGLQKRLSALKASAAHAQK